MSLQWQNTQYYGNPTLNWGGIVYDGSSDCSISSMLQKLFSIMDATNKIDPAAILPVGNTSIQVSMQKDNARLLVLV